MYNLNINKSSIVPTNLIVGRVLDKPFDTIQFKIHNGLDVMDLTGCTLEFRGTTPDNKKVTSNAIKILDAKSGEIEFTFPPNFYSAKGHFQNAYFVIKKGTNSESTNDLLITVLNAVDFNLGDAPIIIDQLDDLIQAVIDDLNNKLSKVKGDIKQTQDNITALKKDVDAYKGQFNTEISKMQKQLDDLAKAINQTDIQRPQLTGTNGMSLYSVDDKNKSTKELIETIPRGYMMISFGNTSDIPEPWIWGLQITNGANSVKTFIGNSNSGLPYSYDSRRGWMKLYGQVPKVTKDNGDELVRFDNPNMSSFDAFRYQIDNGLQSVYLRQLRDTPASPLIGMYVGTHGGIDGTFVGVRMTTGETYTYSHNGTQGRWKRLDNVEYNNATQSKSGLMSNADKVKLDGLKNYNDATTTTSGLMSNTDKVKLDGIKNYSNATQSQSGLMSNADKVKLDGFNSDYKVVMKDYAFLTSSQTYTWSASDLKEELVLVLSRYDTSTNKAADDMFTTEIIPRKHIELFEGMNYRLNLYGDKTKVIYPSLTKITGHDVNGQGTSREFVIRAILVK